MKVKLWIATYVDVGETCDGKPRVLEVCKSKEEAVAAVRNDIEKWADDHAAENVYVDFDAMAVGYKDSTDNGCEWNIEERVLDIAEEDDQAELVDDGQLEFNFEEA